MNFKNWIISLCLLTCFTTIGFAAKIPVAKSGVLDLRGHDFKRNVALKGEWHFYWHQLLNPENKPAKKGILATFPFRWTDYQINGKTLPSFGYASYELQVLLDKNAPALRLQMPDVYSAYRLYINGQLALEDGKVSKTTKGFIPHWEVKFLNLKPGTDTLNFMLQIANFAHKKGGITTDIVLGDKYHIGLDRRRAEAIDLLLTGCLIMGGFFFLGLYLLGSRDKAILLFSLYSIVYSYRIMGTDNYVLHTLIPEVSWYVTLRLEYITLFLGICLFGLYTKALYPEDSSNWFSNTVTAVCIVFCIATLALPPIYFTQLINPFLLLTVLCLIYIPFVYTKAYKKHRPGAIYALASCLALMSIFAISLLSYYLLLPKLQLLSFFGYVAFFFLQSLVLSHRVSFQLKKARQDAELGLIAKSEFLSTMSHEIRTPLNAVIGMSHLLLLNNPREDQRKELDVMLFSANNLLAIVNDILDYNKIEAGKVTFEHIEMDLAAIARNIVGGLQSAAQDKNIALNLSVDAMLKHKLMGDPTRISQIITNLVHNAIKFTNEGAVELRIIVKEQNDLRCLLAISVKDTGIGISLEKQKLIFERFTQADSSTSRGFGGTGLGLAICKKLLELQHTTLQLISEPGKGANFFFLQDFEKSQEISMQQHEKPAAPEEADKPFANIHILLVEDNAMNVLVAKNFLQRWGAVVEVAVNGVEAVEKHSLGKHQLILMDLNMPVMDGYEATLKIRAKGIATPILALTANLPHEIEERAYQAGINDIILKPFLPDELYRKVLHQLNTKA